MTGDRSETLAERSRRLRREFLSGPPAGRPAALEALLALGGASLANDDELLGHVDFALAAEPLGAPLAAVVARHAESEPMAREALVVRAASGRIRDRIRAARLLSRVVRLDEGADAILHGLMRDPVAAVWKAASRTFWRRAAGPEAILRKPAERAFAGEGEGEETATLRRHLAGGLFGLAAEAPEEAVRLIDVAGRHADVWTRAAAAAGCAEAIVAAPRGDLLAAAFERLCGSGDPHVLAAAAEGLRDAARSAACRPRAVEPARRVREALGPTPPDAVDARFSWRRAESVLATLSDVAPGAGPASRVERLLRDAPTLERAEAVDRLVELLDVAQAAVEAAAGVADGEGRTVESVLAFREVVEPLFGEDLFAVLSEVIPAGPEDRQRVRRALRRLHWRVLGLAEEMGRSPRFLEAREGMRALSLAMDGNAHLLRERVGDLLAAARTTRTRRAAAGALARLLDRLRLEDPDGFVEVAVRMALQPAGVAAKVVARVEEMSPVPVTRSHLALIRRIDAGLRAGVPPRRAADLLDGLFRGLAGFLGDEGGAQAARNPALALLAAVASALRYLAGDRRGGSLDGLADAFSALARCERNLLWDDELPAPVLELVRAARTLEHPPSAERLADLAKRIDAEFSAAPAAAVSAAARRAARGGTHRERPAGWDHVRPGDVFHGYEVERVLQTTNLSTVALGAKIRTRRRSILKMPTAEVWNDAAGRDLFLREGHLLQALPAEHVVKVEEIFDDGPPLLVIQYLRGRTLDHFAGMDRRWLLRRCLDILRGLRHVHDFGIVHRDLKPGNVVIVASGRAVLIDFGVAYLDRALVGERVESAELVVGTANYMAPEQWIGRTPGPATDIYALGVMMYEFLAGRLPFEADTPLAFANAHCNEAPPPLPPAWPAALREIVARTLAKIPEERPSKDEVRESIELALAEGIPLDR